MKHIHKYLIKSFLKPFALTFTLAMIVLMLNFLWLYIDEMVGKGLGAQIIGEVFLLLSAQLIPNALILGILLASVMTFGNLSEHNELPAIKSSGISLVKSITPILILVIGLGVVSSAFSNYVIPRTNMDFYTLMRDIRMQKPEIDIEAGKFYDGIEGYSIFVGSKPHGSKTLYDLIIHDHTSRDGNTSITIADSAVMRFTAEGERLVLTLFNGKSWTEELSENKRIQDSKPFRRAEFLTQQVVFQVPGSSFQRSSDSLNKDYYKMLNMSQLHEKVNGIREEIIWNRKKVGHKLIQSHYLKLENKKLAREDSSYYSMANQALDPDSMIRVLPESRQKEIYKLSHENARIIKGLLTDSQRFGGELGEWANEHRNEWHRILTNGFACVLFLLIGAPLGAYIRQGGFGTPVLVSIIVFIIYFIISMSGEKYARVAEIPSWLGMWGAIIILIPVAVVLMKMSNEDFRL